MTNSENTGTLTHWLSGVRTQLQIRREETRALPRPKRNRERERARREARQLFATYYADCAIERLAS
jgi:hypothetical protein